MLWVRESIYTIARQSNSLSLLCHVSILLQAWIFINYLYLFPLSCCFFCHYMHLVVTTGDGKHVSNLAPANLPEWNLFLEFYLSCRPWICFIRSIILPNLASHVFWAACDHLMHKPNITAPGNVSNPVIMVAKSLFIWHCPIFILECP